MILACDEDVGTGIPKALKLVGLRAVLSIPKVGHPGQPDIEWLTMAGRKRWLVFSYNKAMLRVPVERDTLVLEKVGIVFLTTGQGVSYEVLHFLLNRWPWLESIDRNEQRPFAFEVSIKGRPRKTL